IVVETPEHNKNKKISKVRFSVPARLRRAAGRARPGRRICWQNIAPAPVRRVFFFHSFPGCRAARRDWHAGCARAIGAKIEK
ncbi:MAG TPA: hypothetical protein IAA32_05330, partial [Candidatus Butyricicoccus stercorigallinarum]|nr:hypothetical protein [Candidatus Butyricicoccus stercorigallinarum]